MQSKFLSVQFNFESSPAFFSQIILWLKVWWLRLRENFRVKCFKNQGSLKSELFLTDTEIKF